MSRFSHKLVYLVFLFGFFGFLSISLMTPIASNTLLSANPDFNNHLASIVQAKMGLAQGQFPLRVTPYEHHGMGYPLYQFNSPTSYTLAGLILKYISNPVIVYKFVVWLASVLGGIFCYRFLKELFQSRYAALLGAVVYTISPLHIILIDRMGAFNESIAFGIMPILLFYGFQHYRSSENYLLLFTTAVCWYALITVHLVSFTYFSIFYFSLLFFMSCQTRSWEALIKSIIAMAFGCLLASWYLAPTILFGSFLKIQVTLISLATYNYFTPLAGLLAFGASCPWPIATDYLSVNSPMHPAIGWPVLLAVGVTCYTLCSKQALPKKAPTIILPTLLLFFICFFLIWTPFDFWESIPRAFRIGQYPWRFMTQLSWLGAIIFTWAILWLFKRVDAKHFLVGSVLIGASVSSWMPTVGMGTQTLEQLIKKPDIGFSRDDYLLDINKYPAMAQLIESFSLKKEVKSVGKESMTEVQIPRILLIQAPHPKIRVNGEIVRRENGNKPMKLTAIFENKIIASTPLSPGKLQWFITLDKAILATTNKENFNLKFKILPDAKQANMAVAIKEITFLGFLHAPETLLVDEVKPLCHTENRTTICTLEVSKNTHRVNLPVIFYPHLLSVELNGYPVDYQPALYENYPVVSVTPVPGKNVIKTSFHGLIWANYLSAVAWIAGLMICFKNYLPQHKIRR